MNKRIQSRALGKARFSQSTNNEPNHCQWQQLNLNHTKLVDVVLHYEIKNEEIIT